MVQSHDPVLDRGFTLRYIPLGHDDEGAFGCTLVIRRATEMRGPHGPGPRLVHAWLDHTPGRADAMRGAIATHNAFVLYLHGWSDYFFHDHVASAFNALGFDFCAIDLRKNGRSLHEGHTPTAITSLDEYSAEINAAIGAMSEGHGQRRRPLIYAHSTGALTAALWAAEHPGACSGLILNSPWIEMHGGPLVRKGARPLVNLVARAHPTQRILPPGPDFYARGHRTDFGGEWEWHESLKPARGLPFPASTMAAVIEGQSRVARGLGLEIPVLLATSWRSSFRPRWHPGLIHADTVIDVRSVRRRAHSLGERVRTVIIPGAAHDIALSTLGPRRHFLREVLSWLEEEWMTQPGDNHAPAPGEETVPRATPE